MEGTGPYVPCQVKDPVCSQVSSLCHWDSRFPRGLWAAEGWVSDGLPLSRGSAYCLMVELFRALKTDWASYKLV